MFCKTTENIINDRRVEAYSLLRILRKELPTSIPRNFPLVSLATTSDGRISVYKNIQFNTQKVKRKIKFDDSTFKPTLNTLSKIPLGVTEGQYLNSCRNMRLTSFLREHLKISKLKDDKIRDLSNKIVYTLCTDLTTLKICKTPKDHVLLYDIACSCMSPKDRYYNTSLKRYLYDKKYLWPSIWYHYNPHTKGVFLQVAGRGVARTILVRSDIKKDFVEYYDNIYAESGIYSDIFREILNKKGFKPKRGYYTTIVNTVFKVPAIWVFGQPVCPLPFHDCVSYGFGVHFDKEKNVFYFGPISKIPKPSKIIGDSYEYRGYLDKDLNSAHISVRLK